MSAKAHGLVLREADGKIAIAIEDLKPSDRVVVHAKKKAGRLEAFMVQFRTRRAPSR